MANSQRNRLEVACDNAGWTHSRRARCLGFEWSILTNDPALVHWVTSLFEGCIDGKPGPARHVFIVHRHTNSASVSLYRDGRAILRRAPEGLAIAQMVWEVNRGVVEEAGNRLLLHGAAAERDGRIVVLAGPEGSGKSTLVTALVCAGLRYLTDEIVAVEVPAGTLAPYPKPIALHGDALGLLRVLGASLPVALESADGERLVPATGIPGGAVAQPGGLAHLLVFLSPAQPRRRAAARSIPRAEAATAVAEQAFNFRELGPGRLDVIAHLVRSCDCYRLDVGDIDATRRLVLDLLDASVTGR